MSLRDFNTVPGTLIFRDFVDKSKSCNFDLTASSANSRTVLGTPSGTGAGVFRYNFPANASINTVALSEKNNNFQTDQTVNGTVSLNAIQFNASGQGTGIYHDQTVQIKFTGAFDTPAITIRCFRFGPKTTIQLLAMTDTASSARVLTASERVPSEFIPSAEVTCAAGDGVDNGTSVKLAAKMDTSGIITIGVDTSDGVFSGAGTSGWQNSIVLHYIIE